MKALSGLAMKQRKGAAAIGILTVVLIFLLYSMIIPRAELTVKTTVHYSFSGILINHHIENTGTLEMNDLVINITVTDQDGEIEYQEQIVLDTLDTGEKLDHTYDFKAPQVDTYHLVMRLDFECDGDAYNETIEHEMKDYMNFVWDDTIRDWRL